MDVHLHEYHRCAPTVWQCANNRIRLEANAVPSRIMVGTEVHGWISHSYGAINLFLALGPGGCKDEFMRYLFYGTYAQAWQQALMIGKPSVFDRPEWLRIQPVTSELSSNPTGSVHPRRRFHVMTKFPRLTALVRAVRGDPTDHVVASKAARLAEELLQLDWGVCFISSRSLC